MAWITQFGPDQNLGLSKSIREDGSGSGGGRALGDKEKNHPWWVYPTHPAGMGILRVGNF